MAENRKRYKKGELRLELGERATYRFSILSARQVSRVARIYLQKYGLTGNTWRVLSIVGYYGPLSATEVCRHASLEPDKVTRAVDLLVGKGYVRRRQDPRDRRKVILSLSAKGRRVYDAIEEIRYEMEREMMGILSPSELDTLYAILDKLEARSNEIRDNDVLTDEILNGSFSTPTRAVASRAAVARSARIKRPRVQAGSAKRRSSRKMR
jgi:DNA-binding MarR family transcriptional regulator